MAETRSEVRGIEAAVKLLDKRYNIIYADPPWRYKDTRKQARNKGGGVIHQYETMSQKEIQQLPVTSITANDCLLFIWVTFPMLKQALDTIQCWGFEYKTLGWSWIKTTKIGKPCFGVGHYTRSNCEVCLIGKKGRPKVIDHGVSSVIIQPREVHSKKPDIIRELIVQLCGDRPRIELFARQTVSGWDAWGNELG